MRDNLNENDKVIDYCQADNYNYKYYNILENYHNEKGKLPFFISDWNFDLEYFSICVSPDILTEFYSKEVSVWFFDDSERWEILNNAAINTREVISK